MSIDDRWMRARMNDAIEATNEWIAENQQLGGVCDFCSEPLDDQFVTWTTGTSMYSTLSGIAYDDDGSTGAASAPMHYSPLWGACAGCASVVALRDPEVLADHIIEHAGSRAPEITAAAKVAFRAELIALYTVFFERARLLDDRWFSAGARLTEVP